MVTIIDFNSFIGGTFDEFIKYILSDEYQKGVINIKNQLNALDCSQRIIFDHGKLVNLFDVKLDNIKKMKIKNIFSDINNIAQDVIYTITLDEEETTDIRQPNKSDCLFIGFDMGSGDVPTMTIARTDSKYPVFTVINEFTGEEANDMYIKLTGGNKNGK